MHKVLDAVEIAFVSLFIVFVALLIVVGNFPECATEDDTMCVWTAYAHGNGKGDSFVSFTEQLKVRLP